MIFLLFFLQYYQIELRRNSPVYFQAYPFLQYGFKKNSNYFFNFSGLTTEIIFGLATKSELKNINIHKNDPKYCQNHESLSKIQFAIFNDTEIEGKTSSKSVLTPYIFCCNETSSFTLGLNFSNGKSHLDYRCSNAIIYTLFFSAIFFIIFLGFRIYFKWYNKQESIFYYILFDLFFVFCMKNLMNSFLLIISENNEFFSQKVPFGHFPSFVLTVFELLSYILVITELLIVFLFNFAFNQKKPTGFCSVRVFVTIQSTNFVIICWLQHVESNWMTYFVSLALYMLLCFLLLSVPAPFSMTKIGIILDLLGNCFTFTLRNMLFTETTNIVGTQLVFVCLNLVTLFTQISSSVCFLVGFFVCKDLYVNENDDNIHDSNFDILLQV
ncbi:hypothetical protein M9Y10_020921 [Tritrichomonas musculus]|uniref:Uncharacterized protein n=1 Tax=Tritrichomonas musculus TaxID=1915356 RepID=A0ABR2HFW0_9EUKA